MPPFPTIIIVNYDSGEHLERCLESLRRHAAGAPVIVIDNASRDNSESVAAGVPNVTLVRNVTNVGFGTGVNQAARMAGSSSSLLLLNPDGLITAGALERLQQELAAHPECAIAAPMVVNEDGTAQGNVRGDPTMLTGLFGRTTLLTRLFPSFRLATRNVAHADKTGGGLAEIGGEADWVSGACMLVRREPFDAVGGFDEQYFLYWEDADLCRRLRTRGHTIRYVPSARVTHTVGGSSGGAAKPATIREFHRSAYLYYRTHVAGHALARAIALGLLTIRCRWKLAAARMAEPMKRHP